VGLSDVVGESRRWEKKRGDVERSTDSDREGG
jgi:hypothetical protein